MNNFYKNPKWKNKRIRILKRDEYLCQECKRYGKTSAAKTVHHINPLEERPDLALVNINLISLCNDHHEKMHDRTNNKLSALGMEWVKRIESKVPPHPLFRI
ncbi:MAG TPA: HNH endonuclease [Patescibacteria group bacterium]|nr:HNH endonuclease [Patescibacteria group bacterium]